MKNIEPADISGRLLTMNMAAWVFILVASGALMSFFFRDIDLIYLLSGTFYYLRYMIRILYCIIYIYIYIFIFIFHMHSICKAYVEHMLSICFTYVQSIVSNKRTKPPMIVKMPITIEVK